MNHTPGPWIVCDGFGPNDQGTAIMEDRENGNMIASCTGYFGRDSANANARLASVAPDLLEELKSSTAQMRIWVSMNGDMVGALAEQIGKNENATAKATGEML